MQLIDYLGIFGGSLFLLGFYRISIGKWTGKSFWYELDNLVGALIMGVYAYQKHAYVNIFMNIVWGFVAFRGVSTFAERRMKRNIKKFAKMNRKR